MKTPDPAESGPEDESYRQRRRRQGQQRRQVENLQLRHVRPTTLRSAFGPDHRPPTGKHAQGRERGGIWHGTSRVVDRPAKRRANKRSWARILQDARRGIVPDEATP